MIAHLNKLQNYYIFLKYANKLLLPLCKNTKKRAFLAILAYFFNFFS